MSLIKREDLIDHLNACIAESDGGTPITDAVLVAIRCAVEQMPEVDAVPVVYGAWFGVSARELFGSNSDQLAGYVCSECGFDIEECDADAFNYCPNCGAKMDGGTE